VKQDGRKRKSAINKFLPTKDGKTNRSDKSEREEGTEIENPRKPVLRGQVSIVPLWEKKKNANSSHLTPTE